MAQKPTEAEATEALLKLASKTVDDQLGREQKYPELSDFFNSDFSANYVAPDPRQQILRRKRAISLPDTLFEQYNCKTLSISTRAFALRVGSTHTWKAKDPTPFFPLLFSLFLSKPVLECRCFMGLFPEIGRVWITIDHRLFLWNYSDG